MLFDVRMINSSGIGTYIKSLLPTLCKTFKTTVLTDNADDLKAYHDDIETLVFDAPIYSLTEQAKYLKLPPADVFFSPHYNVPILPIKAKARVCTIHDVYHLAHFQQLSYAQKAYAKLVMNRAVVLSDRIITVSEFSKNEIIKHTGCAAEKITVIHNGVKQTALLQSRNEVCNKYHLPEKYFLYVGNVKPHKNLKVFLEAYLLLDKNITDEYKIVIAGKKEGFITADEGLFRLIENSEKLKKNTLFTGFVHNDDMDTLYAAAALLVFPSLYEGFGLPPLEAMLNNCPVISSEIPSLKEVCGNASTFFNPLDKEELAFKISELLTDQGLRQELISRGRQHIKQFTWRASTDKHVQLFKELL